MEKRVHYIGLDVDKETVAMMIGKETDILAALPPSLRSFRLHCVSARRYGETGARRSRKVKDASAI